MNETILLFAFRYALGRCSTAPSFMVDYLIRHWRDLSHQTQSQILGELAQAFEEDDNYREQHRGADRFHGPLGWDCDRATWDRLRQLGKKA